MEALSPVQDAAVGKVSHPCLIVSRLLRPMLGRQEALLQLRYVEGVGDAYHVLLSIVVSNGELECPLALNSLPGAYSVDLPCVPRECQVLEEVRGVDHAVRSMVIDPHGK